MENKVGVIFVENTAGYFEVMVGKEEDHTGSRVIDVTEVFMEDEGFKKALHAAAVCGYIFDSLCEFVTDEMIGGLGSKAEFNLARSAYELAAIKFPDLEMWVDPNGDYVFGGDQDGYYSGWDEVYENNWIERVDAHKLFLGDPTINSAMRQAEKVKAVINSVVDLVEKDLPGVKL